MNCVKDSVASRSVLAFKKEHVLFVVNNMKVWPILNIPAFLSSKIRSARIFSKWVSAIGHITKSVYVMKSMIAKWETTWFINVFNL